jgi:hypothetical protein
MKTTMRRHLHVALFLTALSPALMHGAESNAVALSGFGLPAFRGRPQPVQVNAPLVYWQEVRSEPRPLRIHFVAIDYTSPSNRLKTAIADDPDGDGPAEAVLTPPIELARSAGLEVAINCAPWGPLPNREQKGEWRQGQPVRVLAWSYDGSRHVGVAKKNGYSSFWVTKDGKARGGRLNNKAEALVAAGGWVMVLQDGKARGSTEGLHPRTAVGIDSEHERMILMVVDGRREGVSEGMTENEVGVFLKELGCRFGVNLDGGGSSIMLIPDEAGDLTTVNMPSDGTPRPVPVLFGVAPAGNLDRKKED